MYAGEKVRNIRPVLVKEIIRKPVLTGRK